MQAKRANLGIALGLLALFISLTGTVTAHQSKNHVGSVQLKPRAVGPIHVKKNAVRPFQLAPRATRSFHIAPNAVRPDKLSPDARSPRAYAHVTGGNTVTAAYSRGITGANVQVHTDRFCFYNLGFTPRHVQATIDKGTPGGVNPDLIIQAAISPPSDDDGTCPGNEQASVSMWDVSAAQNFIGPDFFIAFFE